MEPEYNMDGNIESEDVSGDLGSEDEVSGNIDKTVQLIETDPTVPEWAKQPEKPEYEYSEINEKPQINDVTVEGKKSIEDYGVNPMTNAEILAIFNRVFRSE